MNAPTDKLQLKMPAGVIVHGRVTEAESGEPIDRVDFDYNLRGTEILDLGGGGTLQTTDGYFSLYYPPAEKMSLGLSKEGYVGEYPIDATDTVPGTVIGPLDIRLEKAAVIAGRIDYATPYVDRFNVNLLGGEKGQEYIQSTRPRNGGFRFDRVPTEGTFTIQVSSFYTDEKRVEGVEPGTDDLVIEMPETPMLTGIVRDTTGDPVQEYQITISFHSLDGGVTSSGMGHQITEPDGRFEIPLPLAKEMTLTINSPDYVKAWSDPFPVLPDEELEPLEFTLEKGHTLTGRVVDEETQFPVEGVSVGVSAASDTQARSAYASDLTDSNGAFRLKSVPSGPLQLKLHPGYRHNRGYLPRSVDVVVSEPMDVGTIEMPVGGTVEGVIRWTDGEPVTNGRLEMRSGRRIERPFHESTVSSATGYYAFRGLPNDSYHLALRVKLPDQTHYGYSRAGIRSATVNIDTRQTKRLDFELPRGRMFSGTVTQGGEPLDSGRVYLVRYSEEFPVGGRPMGPEMWGNDIIDGEYSFRVLTEGRFAAMVVRDNTPMGQWKQIEIEDPTGRQRLDINLDMIEVSGQVVDATGNPVERVVGYIHAPGITDEEKWMWRFTSAWYSREEGQFRAYVAEPGEYILTSDYGHTTFEERTLEVPESGIDSLRIEVKDSPEGR